MKFCKDCRHIDAAKGLDRARCLHPSALYKDVDLVTGKPISFQVHCHSARADNHRCGDAGQHFEPKHNAPAPGFT